jgi:hypothetical protein
LSGSHHLNTKRDRRREWARNQIREC